MLVLSDERSFVSGFASAQDDGYANGGADAGVIVESNDLANELDLAAGTPVVARPNVAPPPPTNPLVRAFQSLNPDLSVILDGTAGYGMLPSYSLAGDDPELRGGPADHPAGFTLQEAEVAFQAVVDPYFRADLFLTIPNLNGIEVEEAVVTTTSLPWNLQVRAGVFRSAIGRQNGQHLHLQDFTRRPLINEAYLGNDGLRPPGVQVSWLAPTPFYLQLVGEVFSAGAPDSTEHLSTFGGGKRTDLTETLELKSFFPLSDAVSLSAGLNSAFGVTPGITVSDGSIARAGARSYLQGVDLYLKVKPPNVTGSFFSFAWQTEFFIRHIAGIDSGDQTLRDGGLYSQLVFQLARSWFLGAHEDILGLPASALQARVSRTSLSLTYVFSEFARLRLYGEREAKPTDSEGLFGGPTNLAAYLQLEVTFGAHGAHPF